MDIIVITGILIFTLMAVIITWVGISGPFLMSIFSLIWGLATHFSNITVTYVVIFFIISVTFEVLEIFMGGLAAKFYGASRRSVVFAIIGGIVGAIIGASMFILVGAFLGLLVGSYLGAYLSEWIGKKSRSEAARAAIGTVVGNVVSKSMKSITTILMGIWMIKAVT